LRPVPEQKMPDRAARPPVRLIVNPAAGGGRAGRLAPGVVQELRGHGLTVTRADTRSLEHARELAGEAARAGEYAVTLGGDGLAGAVADALRETDGAVLGVLPGGRGNDLARVLGIPLDPIAACAVIARGVPRAMDLGEVVGGKPLDRGAGTGGEVADGEAGDGTACEATGRTFVGIASVGFDSDANRIANEAPAWLGNLVYAYGALRALARWRPARFEVELDPPAGERIEFSGYTVAAANSRDYGGGMQMAPGAMLDDGLLDVVLIGEVGRARFVANLPRVFRGTHVELAQVRVLRAREVAISADRPFAVYADGDPIGQLPVRVRALRHALRVLVPAGTQAAAFGRPADAAAGDASGRADATGQAGNAASPARDAAGQAGNAASSPPPHDAADQVRA
jgi:YegS/Rv2252/BmrU family lipid kinase